MTLPRCNVESYGGRRRCEMHAGHVERHRTANDCRGGHFYWGNPGDAACYMHPEPPQKTSGGGDHPDDLPGCRPKTEHHCIDRINHAPARGPEEAGFCSVLAHEALVTSLMHVDKQRTELLAENARLRRDIERKDREIAWLKRGGR